MHPIQVNHNDGSNNQGEISDVLNGLCALVLSLLTREASANTITSQTARPGLITTYRNFLNENNSYKYP